MEHELMYQSIVYKGKTKKFQKLKLEYELYKTICNSMLLVINLYTT